MNNFNGLSAGTLVRLEGSQLVILVAFESLAVSSLWLWIPAMFGRVGGGLELGQDLLQLASKAGGYIAFGTVCGAIS